MSPRFVVVGLCLGLSFALACGGEGSGVPSGGGHAGGFGGHAGGVSGAGGGTSGTQNCSALLECAAACDSAQCESVCRAAATPTANAQADALIACDSAQGCAADADCLTARCDAELSACLGLVGGVGGGAGGGTADAGWGGMAGGAGGGGGGSGDSFPNRFVGTVKDVTEQPGGLGHLESTGQAVFVRDDQADPRGQSGMFAFYRLESVTYTATASGAVGPCTQQASQTVTFMNPSAFENLVAIRRQPASNGAYEYDITTTLTKPFPNSLTLTCPNGTSTAHFNAELNVAAGLPAPTTQNVRSLVASGSAYAGRTWSWNLQGQ